MSLHVPVAVDLAIIFAAGAFCLVVFLIRAATHSRHADLIAAGMTFCAVLASVRPWDQIIKLREAPTWLTLTAAWHVSAVGILYWYELRPVFRERRLRL